MLLKGPGSHMKLVLYVGMRNKTTVKDRNKGNWKRVTRQDADNVADLAIEN